MCGIAGLIDPDGGIPDRNLILKMTAPLSPRGPDQMNLWTGAGAALGHTRLKVIDLSEAAAQPFHDHNADVHLVFNGELYNFLDLRAELIGHGHTFHSRSDTEVLLRGYLQWGDEVLQKIDGMFAFAIWDGRQRRLLAARDRMGKKPFYFACVERGGGVAPLFAFASELKGLLPLPDLDRRLSRPALAQYLAFEYVPPPLSIIEGVRKLGPAECLTLQINADTPLRPQINRYWKMPFADGAAAVPDDTAADDLWTLLRRAVERRLIADVPLGIFLSGGLDSSAVTAAAASLLGGGGSIQTFAIGFSDPSYDESPHAQAVAAYLGCQHHVQVVEAGDLLNALTDVTRFLDEPLGDASIVPTFLLSRFARQHVTVALGGDGGDELYSGYPTFLADRFGGPVLDKVPRAWQNRAARWARRLPVGSGYFSLDFKINQFLRGGNQPGPIRHQRWLASFLPEEQASLLQPDLAHASVPDPFAVIEEQLAVSQAHNAADRLMEFYARFYLAGDVNVKVDRASGAVGLEVRAPFLDTAVVSHACGLPVKQRVRGRVTKWILRRALKGRLPDDILARGKRGFAVPVASWIKGELLPLLRDLTAPTLLRRQGIFNPDEVGRLVDEHVQGRRDHRKQLWTLLTLQRWLSEYGASL